VSVRLKPNDADVRTNYAVALAGLNQWEEARRQLNAARQAANWTRPCFGTRQN
jgi:Tfp pilus assembly protein PilF